MDFPSHSSKLATRHANKGDALPALSRGVVAMWECLTILILTETKGFCSKVYSSNILQGSRQERKYLEVAYMESVSQSINIVC